MTDCSRGTSDAPGRMETTTREFGNGRYLKCWIPATLAWLAITLASCTGSTESSVPTLLAVGYTDSSGSHLALILDTDQAGDERFRFLDESVRPLPASPRAYDVVDRGGDRTELAVLSRAGGSAPASYLTYFTFDDIDPSDPARFARSPGRSPSQLRLDTLAGAPTDFCPVDVQVGSNGELAALVSNPSACGGIDNPLMYVLDSNAMRLTLPSSIIFDTPAAYVDQADDRLYYVETPPGLAHVRSLPLTDSSGTPREIADVDIGSADVRDLGPVQDSLALLTSDKIVFVTAYRTAPELTESSPDVSNGRRLILDEFLFSPRVLIRGDDRFWVLSGPDDDEADNTFVSSSGATLDPEKQFVYLVRDGGIGIFDLLLYEPGQTPDIQCGEASFCEIAELTNPAFIVWTRAAPEATP